MSHAPNLLPRMPTGPGSEDFTVREAARDGYHRLSLVTGLVAVAAAFIGVVDIVEFAVGESDAGMVAAAGLVATFLVAGATSVACRKGVFAPESFVTVALAVEVGVAVALGASIMGWQHRLSGPELAWLSGAADQPLPLGAGMVPWTGLWVLLFASYVPLRPRQHVVGATLAVATLLLWPTASVLVLGFPAAYEARAVEFTAHVGIWLAFRGGVAALVGYFASQCAYTLRQDLAAAERLGSYRLQQQLGEGGMGQVWRAEHRMLARPAAIKLIRGSTEHPDGRWEEMQRRFEREVQATAQLRSPHTIEIYDFGVAGDGTFYYVMELLDGLDLDALVRRHGPVPWQRAIHFLLQICHSLGEAHAMGLVHRDVKPANIFLCRIGRDVDRIKVLDFGLVKAAAVRDTSLTQQGAFVGTPAFASPEMVSRGSEAADPRSDLYSVGCVAFWLLTGRGVFEAETPMDMAVRHARDEPEPPSLFSEQEVPEALDAVVLSCLAKRASARPESADVLAERLAALNGSDGWSDARARHWWDAHRPASAVSPPASAGPAEDGRPAPELILEAERAPV